MNVNMNFMAPGIIPWNATPGKACGSTLGDICNTSEVRGLLSTHVQMQHHQQQQASSGGCDGKHFV